MLIVLGPLPVATKIVKRNGVPKTVSFCPLSPNARLHWAQKSSFAKLARLEAKLVAQNEILREKNWKQFEKVRVWPTIYVRAKRNFLDDDNALSCLKPFFDGLADAGIVKNDRQMKRMTPEFAVDPDRPRIELRVEAVE